MGTTLESPHNVKGRSQFNLIYLTCRTVVVICLFLIYFMTHRHTLSMLLTRSNGSHRLKRKTLIGLNYLDETTFKTFREGSNKEQK